MKKFLIITLLGYFCFLPAKAQWKNLLQSGAANSLKGDFLSYYNEDKGFLVTANGVFFHTTDNFATFNRIAFALPPSEKIVFFEMYSPFEGVFVSKNKEQVYVYHTRNGCYKWEKVFSLSTPQQPPLNPLGEEKVFVVFKKNSRQLYLNHSDVFAFGNLKNNQWNERVFPFIRDQNNTSFKVFSDSIWMFSFGQQRAYFTPDKGIQWYEEELPNLGIAGNFVSTLNGKIQRFLLNDNSFEELDLKNKVWYKLSTPTPWAFRPERILQLTDTTLLVHYWYWPDNKYKNAVFNHPLNQWIELDTISTLMFFPPSSLHSVDITGMNGSKLCGFKWGQMVASDNYGISWNPILNENLLDVNALESRFTSLHIGKEVGIAWGTLRTTYAFCGENSELWKRGRTEDFCQQLQTTAPCYPTFSQNNKSLYVFHKNAFEAVVEKDSLLLVPLNLLGIPSDHFVIQLLDLQNNGRLCVTANTQSTFIYYYPPFSNQPQLILSQEASQSSHKTAVLEETDNYYYAAINKHLFCITKTDLVSTWVDSSSINPPKLIKGGGDTLWINSFSQLMKAVGTQIDARWDYWQDALFANIPRYFPFDMTVLPSGHIYFGTYNQLYLAKGSDFASLEAEALYPFPEFAMQTTYARNKWWLLGENSVFIRKDYPFSAWDDTNCMELFPPFPNPMSEGFKIPIMAISQSSVNGGLYNMKGQKISDIAQSFSKGNYELLVELPVNLQTDVYLLKLQSSCGQSYVFRLLKN